MLTEHLRLDQNISTDTVEPILSIYILILIKNTMKNIYKIIFFISLLSTALTSCVGDEGY